MTIRSKIWLSLCDTSSNSSWRSSLSSPPRSPKPRGPSPTLPRSPKPRGRSTTIAWTPRQPDSNSAAPNQRAPTSGSYGARATTMCWFTPGIRSAAGGARRSTARAGDAGERNRGSVADPDRRRGFALALLDGPGRTNLSVAASFKHAGRSGRARLRLALSGPAELLHGAPRPRRSRPGDRALSCRQRQPESILEARRTCSCGRATGTCSKFFTKTTPSGCISAASRCSTYEDKTFRGSGAVGLWSAADTIMYFDDISLGASDPR